MRLAGTALSTSVQADMQGPSITTRSPLCRSAANSFRYSMTSPPELDTMRTSAAAGVRQIRDRMAANTMRRTEPSLGQPRAPNALGGRQLNREDAVRVPPGHADRTHHASASAGAAQCASCRSQPRTGIWAPRAADRCLAARAALAGGRLVGDAGVCRAVRQAVDG